MKPFGLCALLLSGLLVFAACGDAEEIDITAPRISQYVPAQGAMGVEQEPIVQVWFDEDIDCATAHDDLMYVSCGGTTFYGSVSCDQAQAMINLALRNPLPAGAACQVTLEPGVRDTVGNRISQQIQWSFQVAS